MMMVMMAVERHPKFLHGSHHLLILCTLQGIRQSTVGCMWPVSWTWCSTTTVVLYCDVCVSVSQRQRPFVRLRHRVISVNEGRRVVFTCEADGVPAPVVFWTKNHVPVENFPHIRVQMKR